MVGTVLPGICWCLKEGHNSNVKKRFGAKDLREEVLQRGHLPCGLRVECAHPRSERDREKERPSSPA